MDSWPPPRLPAARQVRQLYVGIAWLTLVLVVVNVLPVIAGSLRRCYHYYDLGLYAQALAKLGPHHWNPWLPARQVRVFNDHADPILWLAKLWTLGLDPAAAVI